MNGETIHIVPASAGGSRLDTFAAGVLGCGVRAAKRLALEGRILVDGKPRPPHFKVDAGTAVAVVPPPAEETFPEILLAATGTAYTAFIKPAGLHTAAIAGKTSPSLEQAIRRQWPRFCRSPVFAPVPGMPETLFDALGGRQSPPPPFSGALSPEPPILLSRLDAPTSGLVPAAFAPGAAEAFRALEAAGSVDKYYLAVVHGTLDHPLYMKTRLDTDSRKTTRALPEENPDPARHTAVFPLSAEYLNLPAPAPGLTLVAAHIRRGARHQIRAHLAQAGFLILGDPLYGNGEDALPLHLHHARIVFPGFTALCIPSWVRISEKHIKSCLHDE